MAQPAVDWPLLLIAISGALVAWLLALSLELTVRFVSSAVAQRLRAQREYRQQLACELHEL